MSNLTRRAWTRSDGRLSRCSFVRLSVLLAAVAGVGAGAANASLATIGTTSSQVTSGRASHTVRGSARAVFKHLRRAHLRPAPLWPAYLPRQIRRGKWGVYVPARGPTAYSVYYVSRRFDPSGFGFDRGGFTRTTARAFHHQVRFSRRNCAPPRHVRLGGRRVIAFCYPSTLWWGFLGRGGAYLFYTHVYHGVSRRTIGKMIASLRPITQLSPPS
jgi:hypothetical protein